MRTLQEITNEINAEIQSNSVLSAINSTSLVAIFTAIVTVYSRIIYLQEQIFELHRLAIEAISNRAIAGTEGWYVKKMLEFQYGYTLTFNATTYQPVYTVEDDGAKIIKYVGPESTNGTTILKIAKKKVSGLPEPLSGAELIAANTYLDRIMFAGSQISLLSIPADSLRLQAKIYYNGQRDLTEVIAETEAAITGYIASLDFNGLIYRNKLVDKIQALGSDIDIDTFQVLTPGPVWADIDRSYKPASGFFIIDSGYPLSTELTYFAE